MPFGKHRSGDPQHAPNDGGTYVEPTGGALGGDCNHAGSSMLLSEDKQAGTKTYSCQRCATNYTVSA